MKFDFGYVFFMFVDNDSDFSIYMPSSIKHTPSMSPIKYDDADSKDDSFS